MASPAPFRTTLTASVCLLAGGAAGWWLRGDSAPPVVTANAPAVSETRPAFPNANTAAATREASADEASKGDAKDFATAIRAALDDADALERGIRLRQIIRDLDPADFEAVARQIRRNSGASEKELKDLLATRWADFDPRAAVAFARKQLGSNEQDAFLSAAIGRWMERDSIAARAWFDELPPGQEKNMVAEPVIASLSRLNPRAALQLAQSLPGGAERGVDLYEVFKVWLETDPQSAAAAAWALEEGEERSRTLDNLGCRWAMLDPVSACAWASQLPESKLRNGIQAEIAGAWAETDPAAALAWSRSLGAFDLRKNVTGQVLGVWAKRNSTEAQAQALALPPGEERTRAIACVAPFVMQDDPLVAMRLLEQLPEKERSDSFRTMEMYWDFTGLNMNDPATVTALLDLVPAGVGQSGFVKSILGQWAQGDPASAAQWLQRLPASPDRDSAVGIFVSKISGRDPGSAIEWARTIADPALRNERLEGVVHQWIKAAPDAAKQWLHTTNQLSAESKKKLLGEK